jgi:hypothetical protein
MGIIMGNSGKNRGKHMECAICRKDFNQLKAGRYVCYSCWQEWKGHKGEEWLNYCISEIRCEHRQNEKDRKYLVYLGDSDIAEIDGVNQIIYGYNGDVLGGV